MSEQPTYWKHKEMGGVCRLDSADGRTSSAGHCKNKTLTSIVTRDIRRDAPLQGWDYFLETFFEPLPTPQVGEKWQKIASEEVETITGLNTTQDNLDWFMLNYRKVEDAPKEEPPLSMKEWGEYAEKCWVAQGGKPKEEKAPMFEPRYYRHNTTGAIEKAITQERASALENNTDWKRFYYTFQGKQETFSETFTRLCEEKPKEETVTDTFKDKLKQEIAQLDEDMQEIAEEINRLSESSREMYEKQKEWRDMLNRYTEFTDKYCDTLP